LSPYAAALSASTSVISTMPSDNASGGSPFEVSSPMAVVMTRVTPSILPPTIINGEYIQARIKLNPIRRSHLATSRFVVPHTAVTSAPEVLGELDRRRPQSGWAELTPWCWCSGSEVY